MVPNTETRKVLNIGGGPKTIAMPDHYKGWLQIYMDVDEKNNPDIISDARAMDNVPDNSYDAAYASHILEHFHPWETGLVVSEMYRILKPGGFADIRVPNLGAVCKAVSEGHALDTPFYDSPTGPITLLDILFGYSEKIKKGNQFMCHKTAFNEALLTKKLEEAGFKMELCKSFRSELIAMARKLL